MAVALLQSCSTVNSKRIFSGCALDRWEFVLSDAKASKSLVLKTRFTTELWKLQVLQQGSNLRSRPLQSMDLYSDRRVAASERPYTCGVGARSESAQAFFPRAYSHVQGQKERSLRGGRAARMMNAECGMGGPGPGSFERASSEVAEPVATLFSHGSLPRGQ